MFGIAKRLPRWLRIILVITVVLLAISFCLWFFTIKDTVPIPRRYAKGIDFTLYYPTRLPKGYTVDRNTFERKDSVLIFSIKADDGRNAVVSEQNAPAGGVAQPSSSAPFKMVGEQNFATAIGQAHISLWGQHYVSDIATNEGTWVIINVTGFSDKQAAAITRSFTKLD